MLTIWRRHGTCICLFMSDDVCPLSLYPWVGFKVPGIAIKVSTTSVCMYVLHLPISKNHMSQPHRIFCTFYLWPWLSSPLQYITVLSFLWMTSCFSHNGQMQITSHNSNGVWLWRWTVCNDIIICDVAWDGSSVHRCLCLFVCVFTFLNCTRGSKVCYPPSLLWYQPDVCLLFSCYLL